MTRPEDAIERARAGLARMRAAGGYPDSERPQSGGRLPGDTRRKLLEWAMIEPDRDAVRSTRRRGGAITALKRTLLHLMAQYHSELVANQTRFNLTLLGHLERIEQRIEKLEQLAGVVAQEPDSDGDASRR